MTMQDAPGAWLSKATESLAGAEAEFAGGRYNNCANRCYYSCFQAGIAALIWAIMSPQREVIAATKNCPLCETEKHMGQKAESVYGHLVC